MMRPNRPVYLDNQATTPCDSRVVEAMLPWFTEQFGNPASLEHVLGRAAEEAVEAARENIARLVNASAAEIVFTSGATESNNLAIKGFSRFAGAVGGPARPGGRIITPATEHKCVLESVRDLAAEGFTPVVLPVGRDGLLDPGVLEEALAEPALLVSVMAVNNETGVIQDIPRLAAIAHAHGARFHCDAAQAAGKIPVDVRAWDVDLMSLSGHKIYGPKGIGALYVRRRPRIRLAPLFSGGGQERGLRSGTLPAALIVGFGAAARLAVLEAEAEWPRIAALRGELERRLSEAIPGLVLNGSARARIGGNLNLTFPRARAAELMAAAPDLCVSSGSACSAASIEPSYVLRAMGLSEAEAASSLRIGIGRFTSAADIDFAVAALTAAHAAARAA